MTKAYFILTVSDGRGLISARVPYHLALMDTYEWGLPIPGVMRSLCGRVDTAGHWRWLRDVEAEP